MSTKHWGTLSSSRKQCPRFALFPPITFPQTVTFVLVNLTKSQKKYFFEGLGINYEAWVFLPLCFCSGSQTDEKTVILAQGTLYLEENAIWKIEFFLIWNYESLARSHSFILFASTILAMVQNTETELLLGTTSQILLTDISVASPFDADASLNNIFILSRTMATWAAARRQLFWLTTQKSDSQENN